MRPRIHVWIWSVPLQLGITKGRFPQTVWHWTVGPTSGSSTKETCRHVITRMYFIWHMASVSATKKLQRKEFLRCMCPGLSQKRTSTCFQRVSCGSVVATSYVEMISLYEHRKDEKFKYRCGAVCHISPKMSCA